MGVPSSQQLRLMSTCMAPQNSLGVDIVRIIITSAYVILRNKYVIEVLQGVGLPLQKKKKRDN